MLNLIKHGLKSIKALYICSVANELQKAKNDANRNCQSM